MKKFYFHLRSTDELVLDEEGAEFPGYPEALREATLAARDILIDAIKVGRAHVPQALVIADGAGRELGAFKIAELLPKVG